MIKAKKSPSSVYFRAILSLTIGTIIVFVVLCSVYYQRMSTSILQDNANQIYRAAQGTAHGFDASDPQRPDDLMGVTSVEKSFLAAMALSSESYIWLVESDGTISFSTDIPEAIQGQLPKDGDHYKMPLDGDGILTAGVQTGLFIDSKNTWISAFYPVNDGHQFIVMNKAIDLTQLTLWMLSNALAVPVIVSFTIALVLFSLMTRSIVRPIRLLSDAARKVTLGDLTARIHIPEIERESPVKFFVAEELSEMVVTVNHMIERIETQEHDRRVFVSSIAHDLRTPLTSIKGFIAAMLDGTIPPDRIEHYLKLVKQEVDRLQALTASMTEVSSLKQEGHLKMEAFDINSLIHDTLNNLESLLQEKNLGVQLETYKDANKQLMVVADKESISRVVYNLLSNAVKFTPENGVISITTNYNPRNWLASVCIEDSGPGVPADKRQRIFESFFKLDESRANSGSGLGLYICKEILSAHGQRISVDNSRFLGGAKFTFTLSGKGKEDL